MTTYGTAHFPDIDAATRYYKPYGFQRADVLRKIRDGEIHLGKPTLKPGHRLLLVDDGTRYAIEDGQAPRRRLTTRAVEIDYLAHLGADAHCRITIPAGTAAILVPDLRGGWAVEDVALLIKLTGNSHDPHYRYAWLPAEAFAENGSE